MERLPGGLYPGGGPGSRVLRRSRVDGERCGVIQLDRTLCAGCAVDDLLRHRVYQSKGRVSRLDTGVQLLGAFFNAMAV